MAKPVFATGKDWIRALVVLSGVFASSAMGGLAIYVPPDVPGAPPLVTKDVRYRMTDGVYAIITSALRPGDQTTLKGYAINADYVIAKYRTKTGKPRTRRIAVNQQMNTYSVRVPVLSRPQKVILQGRRYDGAAGRVVTHKVSPFTKSYSYNPTRFVPATWTTTESGSMTKIGAGSLTLSGTTSASNFASGFLSSSGVILVSDGGGFHQRGVTWQRTGDAIRSRLDLHFEGTGRVFVGYTEVFNGGFVVRNGGVELFVDGEWQALEFADTDMVSVIADRGSYNFGN